METETADSFGKEWCRDCRRRVTVVDQFEESTYEREGEMGFLVQLFACGHSWESQRKRIGAAPGAPSVGGALPNLAALMRPEAWEVPA